VFIIGVCGGSGSGKTLFCDKLKYHFRNISFTIIRCDNYYKNIFSSSEGGNFDHPSAIDFKLLLDQLHQLKSGRAVFAPLYDFKKHARVKEGIWIYPVQVCVVEGILVFANNPLLRMFDLKVFIDASADIRFIRRLKRDIRQRGRDVDEIVRQYLGSVKPMHDKFIEPTKQIADIVVDGNSELKVSDLRKMRDLYEDSVSK
jgi:Uridine kinase